MSKTELERRVAVLEKALELACSDNAENFAACYPKMNIKEYFIREAEKEIGEVPPTSVEHPKAPRKSNRFVAPSLEEVKSYAEQKGHSDLAEKFYEYFTVGNWTDSKGQKVKNWKQKFITWATYNGGRRKGAERNAERYTDTQGNLDYLFDTDLDNIL